MRLHLVDIDPLVATELRYAFGSHSEVEVVCGNMLEIAKNCVVSPANSYGFMDGGIDAAYLQFFGPSIQTSVQNAIMRRSEGLLPVGAALAVATQHPVIPYLIVAPTMETPEEVPASNAGRAFRAVLRLIQREPLLGDDIYCPGLATLVGRVPAKEAAQSMAEAYRDWLRQTI